MEPVEPRIATVRIALLEGTPLRRHLAEAAPSSQWESASGTVSMSLRSNILSQTPPPLGGSPAGFPLVRTPRDGGSTRLRAIRRGPNRSDRERPRGPAAA